MIELERTWKAMAFITLETPAFSMPSFRLPAACADNASKNSCVAKRDGRIQELGACGDCHVGNHWQFGGTVRYTCMAAGASFFTPAPPRPATSLSLPLPLSHARKGAASVIF